jgi:phosphoribosylamine--glycine ligase
VKERGLRFLLIDPWGDALDVSWRAAAAGNEVRHFIRDTPKTAHIGKGAVNVIRDFKPSLDWADIILMCDNVLYLRDLDAFRAFKPHALIVGPSAEIASWELDRAKGFEICKKAGIATPPYKEFSDYDTAISYVKKRDCRLVSKPFGDADKALTYCAGGPDPVRDLIFMLEKWKKQQKLKGAFILQDFIDGIEIAADGWCGPHGFDLGWSESFEFKKMMSGNFGPNTGEMGTVIRFTRRSKLARQVLEPLTPALNREGYCGYISVNTIIDKNGQPWFLEFTVRPGYPTINIEAAVHADDDPATRLYELASGVDSRSVQLDKIAVGFVIAFGSFPHSRALMKEVDGIPMFGLTDRLLPHFHPCQMQMKDGEWQTAGDYVCVVTAAASTVSSARDIAYKRVKQIHIPGGITVRDDIGQRLSKQLPVLQSHGYASGMNF